MIARMVHQTEATRDKIISIAEVLFIENGFADTQMKDIAAATGMSRNTLYRYYQDKYDLGFAILVMVLKRKIDRYDAIYEKDRSGSLCQHSCWTQGLNAGLFRRSI